MPIKFTCKLTMTISCHLFARFLNIPLLLFLFPATRKHDKLFAVNLQLILGLFTEEQQTWSALSVFIRGIRGIIQTFRPSVSCWQSMLYFICVVYLNSNIALI